MDDAIPDAALLREFAASRSQEAFRILVERHQTMVFGAARRKLNNDAAASEISQIVFAALARKAAWLSARTTVGGWLYKSTLLECSRRQRDESRRVNRERLYSEHMEIQRTTPDDEEAARALALAPVLDDALSNLAEKDREAILLRFMRGLSLRDTGVALGTTEEAARKRVSRAVEKLTTLFRRRGVAMTVPAVVAALMPSASRAAPASLAPQAASAAAALPAQGLAASLFLKATGLTKGHIFLVSMMAAAVPVTMQAQRIRTLESENAQITRQLDLWASRPVPAPRTIAAAPQPVKTAQEPKATPAAATRDRDQDGWRNRWEQQRRLDREARLIAMEHQLGLDENQLNVVAQAIAAADAARDGIFSTAFVQKMPPDESALQEAQANVESTISAVLSDEQNAAYAEFRAAETRDRQSSYANRQLDELTPLHLSEAQKDGLFSLFAGRAGKPGGDLPWSTLTDSEIGEVQAILTADQFRIWQEKVKIDADRKPPR